MQRLLDIGSVRNLLVLCFLFQISALPALKANTSNQSVIDSLEQVLATSKQVYPGGHESQLPIYSQLLDQYRIAIHQNTYAFSDEAMQLAEKYDNDELRLHVLFAKGALETNQGRYQEAKGHLQKGLGLSKIIPKPSIEPSSFLNYLGILYSHLEDYEEATKKYLEVIDYTEKNCEGYPESFCTISAIRGYNNIGTIFNRTDRYEKSLEYYEKALSLTEVLRRNYPNRREIARAMGATLGSIGNVYKKMERFENAEVFFLRSIEYLRIANDQINLPNALKYLAQVYTQQNRLDEAEILLSESIDIKEGLGLMTTEFAGNYLTLSELYFRKGKLDDALTYIDKSVKIVEELEAYSILSDAYELKAKVLTEKKDFVAANEALQKHRSYKEAFTESEHLDKVSNLEANRGINKVGEESEATSSSGGNSIGRYALVGGLVLLLLIFVSRAIKRR